MARAPNTTVLQKLATCVAILQDALQQQIAECARLRAQARPKPNRKRKENHGRRG